MRIVLNIHTPRTPEDTPTVAAFDVAENGWKDLETDEAGRAELRIADDRSCKVLTKFDCKTIMCAEM